MTSSSSASAPCAACKVQRRKCIQECIFAPYFPPDHPEKFVKVHKVFGASNVSKILNELPACHREDAVNSLAFEAETRLMDPVYGCVGLISILQHKLKQVKTDLDNARMELAQYIGPAAMSTPVFHPAALLQPGQYQNCNPPLSAAALLPYNMAAAGANSAAAIVGVPTGPLHAGGGHAQLLVRDLKVHQQLHPPHNHDHHHHQINQQMIPHAESTHLSREEQEMRRRFEQQQLQLMVMRANDEGGYGVGGPVVAGGGRFNEMGGPVVAGGGRFNEMGVSAEGVSSALALGAMFDEHNYGHIQLQQEEEEEEEEQQQQQDTLLLLQQPIGNQQPHAQVLGLSLDEHRAQYGQQTFRHALQYTQHHHGQLKPADEEQSGSNEGSGCGFC